VQTPLVSAIMLISWPRRAVMIQDALLAYQLQSYPRRELVVVNDGAPVRCNDPAVRLVNLPTRASIGAKRNIGLQAARGSYAATWDDDDFALPEHLAAQVGLALHVGATYARSTAMWLADASLHVVGLEQADAYGTAVYNAAAARDVGGFSDTSLNEDYDFFVRLRLLGYGLAHNSHPTYVHRRHNTNVSYQLAGETFLQHLSERVLHTDVAEVNRQLAALRAIRPTITLRGAEDA